MKAVQIVAYGGPEVIEINNNAANPNATKAKVVVEVHAASINPVDWKLRVGFMQKMVQLPFPITLGGDFSGIVTEIGEEVTDFKQGDEVYGQAIVLNGGSGTMAEFASVNATNIAKKPRSTNAIETAGLPLVGSSAIQALEEHIELKANEKILIHGGAGGIGTIAIQLAKALGAYVATTVNSKDFEYVKKLGADEVIDYKDQKFEELLKDFDAVYDTVGGETTNKSFLVLKKGGVLVSMLGEPNPELAQKYAVHGIGQGTKVTTAHLKRLAELVDTGKIKIHVDKVFPIEHAREAFAYQEKNHPQGKVVIKIKD